MTGVDSGDDHPVPADVRADAGRADALSEPESRPRTWVRGTEKAAALLFVPVGLALVVIHYVGAADGLPNAELGALAFGAPYSVLGWLAFLGGRRGRPALTLFASTPLVFMCMISVVLIPLVLPAGFLVVRALGGLAAGRQQHLGWPEVCLPLVVTAAPVLAFGYLLFHRDPAEWQSDGQTFSSTSDIITVAESVLSLGAVAFAVAVAFVWIVLKPTSGRGSRRA